MTCPSITELSAANAASVFGEHLAGCLRCNALVSRLQASEEQLNPESMDVPASSAHRPEPGGVWTIWAPEVDEYLVAAVLDASDEQALILPLLPLASWATEADVQVDAAVLGYAAVASIWASDHVLVEQAIEPVDVLSEELATNLFAAYDAFFAGERIEANAGVPIINDRDPRLGAQAAIADDLRAWYRPWSMLQGAEELGPVIGNRRDELGIDLEPLSEHLGIAPAVWRSFESGEADPYEAVPIAAMVRAVHELGFLASRLLVVLAESSVLNNNRGEDPAQPQAKARRRRGSTRASNRDPKVVQAAARQYGASLAKELGL